MATSGVSATTIRPALPVIELDLSGAPRRPAAHRRGRSEGGKGTRAYRDTKSAVAEDLPAEDRCAPPADRRRRVSGAGASRLRPYRHAPSAGWTRRRDRSQSESLAGLEGGVCHGCAESGRNYTQLIEELVDLAMARYS